MIKTDSHFKQEGVWMHLSLYIVYMFQTHSVIDGRLCIFAGYGYGILIYQVLIPSCSFVHTR